MTVNISSCEECWDLPPEVLNTLSFEKLLQPCAEIWQQLKLCIYQMLSSNLMPEQIKALFFPPTFSGFSGQVYKALSKNGFLMSLCATSAREHVPLI